MPGASYTGVLPALTEEEQAVRDRVERHVWRLGDEIGERNLWRRAALVEAEHYVTDALQACGYHIEPHEYEARGVPVRNLVAEIHGSRRPDEIVLVGAHYDSVMGCPGANDNGTGVAALLEIARLLVDQRPDRTVRFVAFVNEEPPFSFSREMGSRAYSRRSRQRNDDIVAMLSLETIGCYFDSPGTQRYPFPLSFFYPRTGNFIGFVGNLSSRRLVRTCVAAFRRTTNFPSEGAAAPGYMPGIFWSDHWSFWREGYRALMVTDTAPFRYPYYHTPLDTPEKVDYDRTARVVVGLAAVVKALAAVSRYS
jgi:Zn-dependent M28 family amino/carboxypeptidase